MRRDTARNVAIIIGLAAVFALPQLGGAQQLVNLLLRALLIAAFVYFGWTMWRQNRHELKRLPDRQRAMIQAALALLVVLIVASFLFVSSFAISLLFLVLIVGLGYLVWRLWTDAQRYY
jgi:hypothetical protein